MEDSRSFSRKSGTGHVLTVGHNTFPLISTLSRRKPAMGPTGRQTSPWPACPVIRRRPHGIFVSSWRMRPRNLPISWSKPNGHSMMRRRSIQRVGRWSPPCVQTNWPLKPARAAEPSGIGTGWSFPRRTHWTRLVLERWRVSPGGHGQHSRSSRPDAEAISEPGWMPLASRGAT